MQLTLDSGRAPNPRRVRIYVAEKGLDDLPIEEIDLRSGVQRGEEFREKNPFAGVPILELDDGKRRTHMPKSNAPTKTS